MVDAHCHLQEIDNIPTAISGLDAVLCCGSGLANSQQAGALAAKYPTVYAAVGVHPEDLVEFKKKAHEDNLKQFLELTTQPKVVAIGECGLDYTDQTTEHDKLEQKKLLEFNLQLARQTKLPLVIHCRNAFADIFKLVDYAQVQMHCFTGNLAEMQECIGRGWYISFGGILTFKSSHALREVAKQVPSDKLLIETDSPYLAPEPLRGDRNIPQNVKIVAQTLATVRGVQVGEIDRLTSQNARVLFGFT